VTADDHVPALLLAWRETPDGWQGRVVRPVLEVEDEKWRPREEWLPAEHLEGIQSSSEHSSSESTGSGLKPAPGSPLEATPPGPACRLRAA
jgi:hypothetical protein